MLLLVFLFFFIFSFFFAFIVLNFSEVSCLLYYLDLYSFDIFYIHIFSSLFNLFLFWFCVFITLFLLYSIISFSFLLIRHTFVFISIFYCIFSIVTGEIWSVATWGTWAPFDSRFISQFLILILNFFVFIFISYSLRNPRRNFVVLSHFLFLFIALNFPLVKYSVSWWNSLHMPSLLKLSHSIQQYFFIDFFFFTFCFSVLYLFFFCYFYCVILLSRFFILDGSIVL